MHIEHGNTAGHARHVPSKWLVESLCVLPGEAKRNGGITKRLASGADAWRVGGEQCRGGAAHSEHPVHAGHARDVPSKWLVKSVCVLPNEVDAVGKQEDDSCVALSKCMVTNMVQRQVELHTWNSWSILVTSNTSQYVMCPYLVSAAVESCNHSFFAPFRAKVLLKLA